MFPNLRRIVVAGHSAGGQFTLRYAMSNKLHDELAIEFSYVVAKPSSYPWPDTARPLPVDDAHPGVAEQRLVEQLARRPTTYVLGQSDVLPVAGFDASCAAMMQGPTRRARGEAFLAEVLPILFPAVGTATASDNDGTAQHGW